MIAQKQQAFRLQIRSRNHTQTIQKLRFQNWLQFWPASIAISSQFLHTLSQCRLSSKHPSQSHTLALLQFVSENLRQSWTSYLCVCREIVQYDLLSVLCEKMEGIDSILEVVEEFLRGQARFLEEQPIAMEGRQAIEEIYGILIKKSTKSINIRLVKQINMLTNEKSMKTITNIAWIINRISSYTNQQQFLYAIFPQPCHSNQSQSSIIVHISRMLYRNHNCLSPEHLRQILYLMSYVMESIDTKLSVSKKNGNNDVCYRNINNGRQQNMSEIGRLMEVKKQGELQLLRGLNQIFVWNQGKYYGENQCDQSTHLHSDIHQILVRILGCLTINDEKYYQLVQYAIKNSITTRQGQSGNQQGVNQWQIRQQCMRLMHRVSLEQEWICYEQVREFIRPILSQICSHYANQHLVPSNPFINLNNPHCLTLVPVPTPRLQISRTQQLVLKTMVNLLANECQHHCTFDYYGMLELMGKDVMGSGMLHRWVRERQWRVGERDLVGQFVNLLLNVKREDIKIQLVKECWPLVRGHGRGKGQVGNKLRLYSKLYGISHDQRQLDYEQKYEDYGQFHPNYDQDELYSNSSGSQTTEIRDKDMEYYD